MEEFLKSFLEPASYFIYAVIVYLYSTIDKSVKIKSLLAYYVFACIFLFIGQFVVDNNWVYNVFFFITVNLLSYFYYSILRTPYYRSVVLVFCSFMIIVFLVNDILAKEILQENNYVRSLYFFTIIMYSLLYFYEMIKEVNECNILEQFEFWLVSGYLLYFLGGLCIVLYYKYPTITQRGSLWMVQSVILFCSSLITGVGTVWLMKQKKFH